MESRRHGLAHGIASTVIPGVPDRDFLEFRSRFGGTGVSRPGGNADQEPTAGADY